MRAGAALPVTLDRRAVPGPPRDGTQEEQLLERQLSLEDVPLGKPGDPFDVERVRTCRCKISDGRFGAYRASVAITASPNASRLASVQPPVSSNGAYCTKMLITCFPGGAIPGSIIEGMTTSMYGCREKSPYLASSKARSR
jgi:hypothetical protein